MTARPSLASMVIVVVGQDKGGIKERERWTGRVGVSAGDAGKKSEDEGRSGRKSGIIGCQTANLNKSNYRVAA